MQLLFTISVAIFYSANAWGCDPNEPTNCGCGDYSTQCTWDSQFCDGSGCVARTPCAACDDGSTPDIIWPLDENDQAIDSKSVDGAAMNYCAACTCGEPERYKDCSQNTNGNTHGDPDTEGSGDCAGRYECCEPPPYDGNPNLDGNANDGLLTYCDGSQKFIDSTGCDLFRDHVYCDSADAGTNNGKCVAYTHGGGDCKAEAFHSIPKCEDLDMISHKQDIHNNQDIKALTGMTGWTNRTFSDAQQSGDYAGQGMRGWHFCQSENKCYHPQAGQQLKDAYTDAGNIIAGSHVTGASAQGSGSGFDPKVPKDRVSLPRPDDCFILGGVAGTCAITDRCDDHAGVAGTEQGNKEPGDKGNWRDHIFEAPDRTAFGTHDTATSSPTCTEDYAQATSASCLIHSLPKTNSYESITQCAHGIVAGDHCNGVTFYFNVEGRGHNFQFNFCRHGTDAVTGASIDGDGAWAGNPGENQWVKR